MNQSITETLIKANLPKHVAIIMDGNGRWAKQKGKDRTAGHQEGVNSVKEVIDVCGELGIPYLTLFAFSTENWKRPKLEVDFLMSLLIKTLRKEIDELHEKGIKLSLIGEIRSEQKGKDRNAGHQEVVNSVKEVIDVCGELGIPYLTLFAFSTENWKRPKLEVDFLMSLLIKTLRKEIDELHEKGIKLSLIGEIDQLPNSVQKPLQHAVELIQENKKANLIIALNYGSKAEIVRATKNIAEDIIQGKV